MDQALRAGLAFVGAILSLAILSVILSQKAQTTSVIGAMSSGLSSLIGAAEAPVTGATTASSVASTISSIGNNAGLVNV